ncbi:hypothetical protein AVEN_234632-1 [Araneus ventricosus]|uniref:Uncharacterized protein n=1 Tax=Araneus ventricosus TaxID=182803 RepID=A0A4Y2SAU7_ARAVE|nr:hypothetical protein AVEN_234632-1 [Araneus ventricosus]
MTTRKCGTFHVHCDLRTPEIEVSLISDSTFEGRTWRIFSRNQPRICVYWRKTSNNQFDTAGNSQLKSGCSCLPVFELRNWRIAKQVLHPRKNVTQDEIKDISQLWKNRNAMF